MKIETKNFVSISEFAKSINKTHRYINKLIENGKITKQSLEQKGKRFLIDPVSAVIDINNNTSYINKKQTITPDNMQELEQKIRQAGTQGMSLANAQRIQAQYKAALLKLEYEEKIGKFVLLAQVETDFFNIARLTRDAILNIPGRVSAKLASTNDVHTISESLTAELTEALEELSYK